MCDKQGTKSKDGEIYECIQADLCSIMRAAAQTLHSDLSPHFYYSGVTGEMILKNLAVTTCIILYVSLGKSFYSVGAKKKSYEKNKKSVLSWSWYQFYKTPRKSFWKQ